VNAPLYVLGSATDLASVVRSLASAGWTVRSGLRIPDEPWDLTTSRTVVTGTISDEGAVADAVLAAARGAAVAAVVDPDTVAGRALLADLARIGTVLRVPLDGVAVDENPDGDGLPLTDEQRALLDRLATGESIAAAATAEFLSLRTANRRIAAARDALGVRTTREAVVEYVKRRPAGDLP
jgi:DNA-binding NarL/FixJ family response regulator